MAARQKLGVKPNEDLELEVEKKDSDTANPATKSENENKEAAKEDNTLTPLSLRTYDGPMYVQNVNTRSQLIATSVDGNERIKLGPKGNENGDDVAILPLSIAQNPQFQKVWRRGDVLVTTDPKMEEVLLVADQRRMEEERIRAMKASEKVTESLQDRDLVKRGCVECDETVYISMNDLKKKPPLCDRHAHQFDEAPFNFLQTPTEKNGKVEDVWKKIG